MSDLHDLLERGVGGYTPPAGGLERARSKMHRRQTSVKVATIVVALVIGGASVGLVLSTLGSRGTPGDRPPPPNPAALFQVRPVVAVSMPSDAGYSALAVTCGDSAGCAPDQLVRQQPVTLLGYGRAKYQLGPVIVTGADVVAASTLPDVNGGNGGWRVSIQLTPSGATALSSATSAAIGAASPQNEIAFIVNGRVVSAIIVQAPISSGALQVSNLPKAEAQTLASQLGGS